ncbi:MAG: DUF5817 domain-containing protein [Thermoplasmata archaeon]
MNKEYGIIVCTNCKFAKVVDLSNKSTKCNHCGKNLKISKMKIHYKTDSQSEASWAVGRINAKVRGKEFDVEEEKKEKDPYSLALEESKHGSNKKERLEIMCRVLTDEIGKIDREDLKKLSEKGDLGDVDDLIESIRKLEDVYEPEHGIFKSV